MLDEDVRYRKCQTVDDVLKASDGAQNVPDSTLLRCAIADLSGDKKPATTEAIFLVLEGKIPWLRDDEGSVRHVCFFLHCFWETTKALGRNDYCKH